METGSLIPLIRSRASRFQSIRVSSEWRLKFLKKQFKTLQSGFQSIRVSSEWRHKSISFLVLVRLFSLRGFQSIRVSSEWRLLRVRVRISLYNRFQSIRVSSEWRQCATLFLTSYHRLSVSNQLGSPASGDLGDSVLKTHYTPCFQSIRVSSEWRQGSW